ncbi:MAG: NAD-dependent epimerase/dehydratase family protein [Gemmatimonadetes bacterium]|nr:NAD-dependent epimerase/dehydratase family protein [Gemmatimonadota bacterium]MBT4609125.1 NAD-dependent epimerase/dehydratase family protein [Gemmatimonadota bacterium]MBT5054950.1 NAD-dependent epimerase/dehydratase family protein [Gemmatimonadota bacterium]MBT5145020.1 NAD-dependent epimerase/dehydratase family protein [Gemmatimonadota bacterium]MBT5592131.1 NAD-dependent epimerase/dehydratase family protein [Gemmatimonadota bacterium]
MSIGKLVVTGGYGFVGTNLILAAAARGTDIVVLDDLSVGDGQYVKNVSHRLVEGDIRDRDVVSQALDGADAVVHLAAHTSVVDSQTDPEHDCDVNVRGTMTVLRGCVDAGVKRFVLASSNAPLGEQIPPVDEERVPKPMSPYGASKLAGEGYCSSFAASYGLGTTVLRFANVYGMYSTHKSSVVAKFLRRIQAGEGLVIYGDGEQTRDFVHVEDLAQGILAALQTPDAAGETFQLGSGTETSVLTLVDLLRQVAGGDVQITHEPERPGEIRRNWTDIGKAQRILGYQPSKQLAPSLAQMHEWFQGQRAEVTESAIVSPTVSPTVSADDFMDADEEEAVAKRLRDLGYL